jgi:hypothetical protein
MEDEMTLLLVWVHVAAMIAAISVFVGCGTMIRLLAARGDAGVLRTAVAVSEPLFRLGGICSGVGIIAGLILARNFGYGAPWLLGAYALTALGAALGIAVDGRWAERLAAADDASYAAIRSERLPAIVGPLGALIWASILWLMIAKPS